MKVINRLTRYFAPCAVVLAFLILQSFSLRAAPVQATTTERFVDSMGVNVHWSYPEYNPGVYQNPVTYNHQTYLTLKARLGELGIRHLRDHAMARSYLPSMELYNTYGVKTLFQTGKRLPGAWPAPLDPSQIPAELQEIKNNALAAVGGLEGVNEYDLFHDSRETAWASKLRTYQQNLWNQAKADPLLQNIPIIGPSLTNIDAYRAVGNLDSYINYACVHHYQSDRHPGSPGWGAGAYWEYGSINWAFSQAHVQSPSRKPVQFTECGYGNLPIDVDGKDMGGLSETAARKYTLRMWAEFYRRGIYRSFKYELRDMGRTNNIFEYHGLLRSDLTPKPAFTALKNLISLVKEPGASFTPTTLNYALSGNTTDVRHVLLQKSNGQFYLLIWKEVPSWNVTTNTDIVVAPGNVTLTFNQPVTQAIVYRPSVSTSAQNTYANPPSVSLSVPDELLVVRIDGASTPLNYLGNGSFDQDSAGTQSPAGWTTWGGSGGAHGNADYTQSTGGSHGGIFHAVHYKNTAYEVYTYRQITGMPNGSYTLSAWVKGSGGQSIARMQAEQALGGVGTVIKSIPATSQWTKISLDFQVTNGACYVGFYSVAPANSWIFFDDVEFRPKQWLQNGSFDQDTVGTQNPSGWTTWGGSGGAHANADYTQSLGGSYGGALHCVHYKNTAYEVYTYRQITGLPNGSYTLSAWVKNSGGQSTARMQAEQALGGVGAVMTSLPAASSQWMPISLLFQVTDGTCFIGFYSVASADDWILFDEVEFRRN